MADTLDSGSKRSVARLRRLGPMLEEQLDDPTVALELLVAEAESGEPHPELWERLHAAAARDDKLIELGAAYEQLAKGRRLRPLPATTQAEMLMHGADFQESCLGDADGADAFLDRVLAVAPEHGEAFSRLERHLTASRQQCRLIELYATVANAKKEPPVLLIGRTLALIELLPPDQPVPIDACERLVRAGGKNPRVISVIEAHCKKGGRFQEAAALLELALQVGALEPGDSLELRRRLVALYTGEVKTPEASIPHVEEILRADWTHVETRKVAERLLSYPSVAGRAAAVLQDCRRRAQQES
jgi:golgin subfamily B member 1